MNTLKIAMEKRGIKIKDAAKLGIPYCTMWQQVIGRRSVGVRAALRYEKELGIPRWELRPDLWDAPTSTTTTTDEGKVTASTTTDEGKEVTA